MRVLLLVSSILSIAHGLKHCPVQEKLCPVLCKQFQKEVPRPTLYDHCLSGCSSAVKSGASIDCSAHCNTGDLPKPTTSEVCKTGCKNTVTEIERCDAHAEKKAAAAAAPSEEL